MHIGIHPQRQRGLFYAGVATTRGKLSGEEMIKVARLAAVHAGGRVRLTTNQNIVILDVQGRERDLLAAGLASIDLRVEPSSFRAGTLACTGKQFCKLALTETKDRASELIEYLERVLPNFNIPFRISVTGCPNSCAHYQVCDVGFVGDFISTPNGKKEAYRVYLGGHLGSDHAFGRELNMKVPADEIEFFVERLARAFLVRRESDREPFHSFIARQSLSELEALVLVEEAGVAA